MLQYFKAQHAARRFAKAELALSHPSLRTRLLHRTLIHKMLALEDYLPSFLFKASLSAEDDRRLRLERGLGVVYKGEAQRFYPVTVLEQLGPVVDEIAGHRSLVYIDPVSEVPVAGHTDASSARWDREDLVLDSGDRIRDRQCVDANGVILPSDQPLQLFTRWYGLAPTFPNCDIYAPERAELGEAS